MGEFFGLVRRYWIYIVLGIFVANSLILDLFIFFPKASQTTLSENVNLSAAQRNYCPQSCVDQINSSLTSQKTNIVSPLVSPTVVTVSVVPTPSITPTSSPTPTPANNVKEFFIPLGTGTGKSIDWTVVDGIGAKIDPSDYGSIKQITFEVTAQVPSGNQQIWIRLYNANTFQSVAGSDVTLQGGGTATLLISSPINLSSGNNLYQIQMKTQLQANTDISMARIRIKTN